MVTGWPIRLSTPPSDSANEKMRVAFTTFRAFSSEPVSKVTIPVTMTHASVPVDRRQAMELSDGIVRLSCGIEEVEDLIADLEQALAQV
jgi:cystathionine gamma-lyase / homocysteine desulfhydrase